MSWQSLLTGKCDAVLKEQWLEHVRGYGPHQSKPDPGPFKTPITITKHPLRFLGKVVPPFHRVSGLALTPPGSASAERFKIWEMPGNEYSPSQPYALLGQDLPEIFRDYLPSFRSRLSFVLKIPQGLFHGHDQTLFDRDYNLIDWEPPYWALDCGLPGTMFRGRLPQPKRLKGRALVLSAPGATKNIWHLLFDSLPKLELIRRAGIDPYGFDHFLVNSREARSERGALEMLGVPSEKIIETDKSLFIQADELFFVTLGCLIPPDPWVLKWVRSSFLNSEHPPKPNKRIFLSRGDAGRRRFRDEHLLWERLQASGFDKVEFAGMGLREQIDCVQSASAIVAPHGAGLTNLVWASPGAKVVELFSREYITGCYWLIADMLGLDYAFAIGAETSGRTYANRAIMDMERLGADIAFPDIESLSEQIMGFVNT